MQRITSTVCHLSIKKIKKTRKLVFMNANAKINVVCLMRFIHIQPIASPTNTTFTDYLDKKMSIFTYNYGPSGGLCKEKKGVQGMIIHMYIFWSRLKTLAFVGDILLLSFACIRKTTTVRLRFFSSYNKK